LSERFAERERVPEHFDGFVPLFAGSTHEDALEMVETAMADGVPEAAACFIGAFDAPVESRTEAAAPDPSEEKERLDRIREQEALVLDAARKRAVELESEAYEKGFAQGEKDGLEMGVKKAEKTLERMESVLQHLEGHHREFVREHENHMIGLICSIAKRAVGSAAAVDNRSVRHSILEALEQAADCREITVRVNGQHLDYVKEIRPEFFGVLRGLKSVNLVPDSSVSPGGCVMETSFGRVDACLETRMEQIAEAVVRAHEEASASGEG